MYFSFNEVINGIAIVLCMPTSHITSLWNYELLCNIYLCKISLKFNVDSGRANLLHVKQAVY